MATVLNVQDFVREFGKGTPKAGPNHKPRSIEELGIRESLLEDLALKTLYLAGTVSVLELGRKLGLGYEVMEELVERLRAGKVLPGYRHDWQYPSNLRIRHGKSESYRASGT